VAPGGNLDQEVPQQASLSDQRPPTQLSEIRSPSARYETQPTGDHTLIEGGSVRPAEPEKKSLFQLLESLT